MMNKIILILCVSALVSTLEVVFEKFEKEYYNTKYFKELNVTLRRTRRNRPYTLNGFIDLVNPIGNNLTIDFTLYELIAGRYILTPLKFGLCLCDYLYKDSFEGNIFAYQLPKGWKCPIPAGVTNYTNIELRFDKIPYIPFTYSSLIVRVVTITKGSIHNEPAFQFKAISVVTQKLKEIKSRKKNTKA